jgi:hypothetical protein
MGRELYIDRCGNSGSLVLHFDFVSSIVAINHRLLLLTLPFPGKRNLGEYFHSSIQLSVSREEVHFA